MRRPAPAFLSLLLTGSLLAAEGKWTPQQVTQIDAKWLREIGLELPPQQLWDPEKGTGLLAATINIGGCSAGWISAEGLLITNHHCLFGVLQEHATPENDIITNGFLARSRDRELKSSTVRATIPRRFTDVTSAVNAAVPAGATDAQRAKAIEKKTRELQQECEAQPGARCLVAAHDGGLQYVLQEMAEIADIRLVYAPPRAIGEYGGEIDNWMWPRHTGDFAIARAWVDGKPFRPPFYFPLSTEGVEPGDFVMVLGYPGSTYRALTAAEMEERLLWFGARASLYREWISILERTTAGQPAGVIAVADALKTLQNRQKNGEGQLDGFRRNDILGRQKAADDAVVSAIRTRAAAAKVTAAHPAIDAHEALARIAFEKKEKLQRDFLLDHVRTMSPSTIPPGPKPLSMAWLLVRNAMERQLLDSGRDTVFTDRNRDRLRQRLDREQKNLFPPADRALFTSWVRRALALPASSRLTAIDAMMNGATDGAAFETRIEALLSGTKVTDPAERAKMIDETPEQLATRRDPLLDAAFALDRDIRQMDETRVRWTGAIARLRPEWRRAVIAHAGKPVAPDANSTLRVSFAHVQGYSPRDAVFYQPMTTLAGAVDKHTGEEPFDLPENVLAVSRARTPGRWDDPKLRDVPVAFLADGDTTGGNSGSPVVNGRGELVGVNFDRVWENVANDFGFLPRTGRNISVDVRYMLWLLEEVEKAGELMEELGVRRP